MKLNMWGNGPYDAELAIQLKNENPELLVFNGELRATINGRDLDRPIPVKGFVNGNQTTDLIVRMPDVPVKKENGNVIEPTAAMRYDLKYNFADNEEDVRRTSKRVVWHTKTQLKGLSGTIREEVHVDYDELVEE